MARNNCESGKMRVFSTDRPYMFNFLDTTVNVAVGRDWKVGNRVFVPRSGIQDLKKQNVSSPITCKNSVLSGASVTER